MIKEKLLEKINALPDGIDVTIFDWRKNLHDDWGDGSSTGIYSDFDIEVQTLEPDEAKSYKEQHERDYIPFASMTFENDDYSDEGTLII